MSINPGAAEAPHRQIAAQLRARIHRGEWAPGERLPSIPAMAGLFGVAKQTVQRTVDQLRVEGLLITRPGSGTYVRGTKRRLNRLSRGRYGAQRGYHADLAARYRQQLVEVGRAPAPPEVADAFGVSPGTPLVARRHVVRTGPLYQEVEEVTGRRYVTATDHLTARLPTREEAETLQIRPDTPVLALLHVAYDADHRPIEVAQATWPGPMTTLVEEYPIPAPRPTQPEGPDFVLA